MTTSIAPAARENGEASGQKASPVSVKMSLKLRGEGLPQANVNAYGARVYEGVLYGEGSARASQSCLGERVGQNNVIRCDDPIRRWICTLSHDRTDAPLLGFDSSLLCFPTIATSASASDTADGVGRTGSVLVHRLSAIVVVERNTARRVLLTVEKQQGMKAPVYRPDGR